MTVWLNGREVGYSQDGGQCLGFAHCRELRAAPPHTCGCEQASCPLSLTKSKTRCSATIPARRHGHGIRIEQHSAALPPPATECATARETHRVLPLQVTDACAAGEAGRHTLSVQVVRVLNNGLIEGTNRSID